MPLLAIVLLLPIAILALMPVILVQRYRVGSSRRRARPWLARINALAMTASAIAFLLTAAVIDIWVPSSLVSAGVGIGLGVGLGLVGLWLTRWEGTRDALHYTPNRWLVLVITLLVTARIVYGIARGVASLETAAGF